MSFSDFELDTSLQEGIDAMGYKSPTPIQVQTIPLILAGRDIIACAQTGTGKTAAYLLPVLNGIVKARQEKVSALVIAPTRELALQIDQALEGFAYFAGTSSLAIYGGGDATTFDREKKALKDGADVVIATPGRLISHLNLGYVDFSRLRCLILDEADKMLDMGFLEDIMKIAGHLPPQRQTLMFSATMPPKIRDLARRILREPEEISIAISKPAEGILQAAYMVHDAQKIELVKHLLDGKKLQSVIIFCSTKKSVKYLEKELRAQGLSAGAIHSDLEQKEREEVMILFKSRQLQILVATDILSRGIDIEGIDLVINYEVPHDAEDYVHRIGRTARAASTGVAITFVNKKQVRFFKDIERQLETQIRQIPLPSDIGPAPAFKPQDRNRGRAPGRPGRFRHGNRPPRKEGGRH